MHGGLAAGAVGGHDVARVERFEGLRRLADDGLEVRAGEVKAAHHRENPVHSRDLPRIGDRVDDAGMGAAGEHDEPLPSDMGHDGGIVLDGIELLHAVLLVARFQHAFLEIRSLRDFPQEQQGAVEQGVRGLRSNDPHAAPFRAASRSGDGSGDLLSPECLM